MVGDLPLSARWRLGLALVMGAGRLAFVGVTPSGEAGRGGALDSPSELTPTDVLLCSVVVKIQKQM